MRLEDFLVLVMLTAAASLVCWFISLAKLMHQPDHFFPGRYDKVLWVGIIVLVPIAGAAAYGLWHYDHQRSLKAHEPTSQAEAESTRPQKS